MVNNKTLQRHNELKAISSYIYDTKNRKLPEGYKMLYDDYNPKTGFMAA